MVKKTLLKLKNTCGETLLETVVSILIAVLSVSMLGAMFMAASRLNDKAGEADAKFASDLKAAETQISYHGESSTGMLSVIPSNGAGMNCNVVFFGTEGGLVSYALPGGGG